MAPTVSVTPVRTIPIATLKNRAEFQRVRGGGRATALSFVLEGKKRDPGDTDGARLSGPRFGFTITKKVGNAVTRNKMRRRLRGALSEIAGDCADPDTDYVVVARAPAAIQEYATLRADLRTALLRVQRSHRPKSTGLGPQERPRHKS